MPASAVRKSRTRDDLKDLHGLERIEGDLEVLRRDIDGFPDTSEGVKGTNLDSKNETDLGRGKETHLQETDSTRMEKGIPRQRDETPPQQEEPQAQQSGSAELGANDIKPVTSSKEIISKEPKGTEDMSLAPRTSKGDEPSDSSHRSSMVTLSSDGSGYERETHECTEFCIDFLRCFGMFDECCPSSGEGYFTTAALFCANILVGIRKC